MGLDRFAATARSRQPGRDAARDPAGPRPPGSASTDPVAEPGDPVGETVVDEMAADDDLPEGLLRVREGGAPRPEERCELCTRAIGDHHRHVVDLAARSLQCACRPCALLFTEQAAAGGHYRTVPETHRRVAHFVLQPQQWTLLRIPVDLAFVMDDTIAGGVVAFYPSPAGATESELSLAAWQGIVAANPSLAEVQPDVEAVLIRVRDDGPAEAWIVPIDRCYELVGHLRLQWRGFGGGQQVRDAIDAFFADVATRTEAGAVHA